MDQQGPRTDSWMKTYAELPADDDSYALYHVKNIDRQRQQNLFYSTILTRGIAIKSIS